MRWKTRRKIIDLSEHGMIMGILNATPDSFSDGGNFSVVETAVQHAIKMQQEGAQIIDIGGESTRPGAEKVSADLEIKRVVPVIEKLRSVSDVIISIDTSKAIVAEATIRAGADIVNDVSGCSDPAMPEVCKEHGAGLVIMHMQGNPQTMQENPRYSDVVSEVREYFEERYESLVGMGIDPTCLCFDPGIGFGKSHEHNLTLIRELKSLPIKQRPLLLGVSRKSVIGKAVGIENPQERDGATVALTAAGRMAGCMLHRVHAVRENYDALRMVESVMQVDS